MYRNYWRILVNKYHINRIFSYSKNKWNRIWGSHYCTCFREKVNSWFGMCISFFRCGNKQALFRPHFGLLFIVILTWLCSKRRRAIFPHIIFPRKARCSRGRRPRLCWIGAKTIYYSGDFLERYFLFDPSLTSDMSAALMQGHCLQRRPCIKRPRISQEVSQAALT